MKVRVAVYGTLRSIHGNNAMLGDDAVKVGEGVIPDMSMYNLGWFPGIVHDGGRGVKVEVYDVNEDIVPRLDRYEGYSERDPRGSLYVRVPVEIPDIGTCQTYVYNHPVNRAALVPSGDWADVDRNRNSSAG